MSPYAVAKLAGEGYCRSFHQVYGLETVALRYFNVFGPRQDPRSQYAAVIPNFITHFLEGTTPVVYGDGTQSRDFTYVDNVVEANVRAMTAPVEGGSTYNAACGQRISLLQLLERLSDLTGVEVEATYEAARPGDVPHSQADISKARRELDYQPTVDFADGLRRTFEFFAEERDRSRLHAV